MEFSVSVHFSVRYGNPITGYADNPLNQQLFLPVRLNQIRVKYNNISTLRFTKQVCLPVEDYVIVFLQGGFHGMLSDDGGLY